MTHSHIIFNPLTFIIRATMKERIGHALYNSTRDRGIIETELIIADLESLNGRMDKLASLARGGDKEKIKELAVFEKILVVLNEGKMAIETDVTEEEHAFLKTAQLLTYKPIIYACNVAENELHTVSVHEVKDEMGLTENDQLITISAKIEEDLQDLSAEDAQEFLEDLGVTDSGLDRLIHAAYAALGYETYFTAGVQEVRAWNILKGSTAPQAAGVIHTDFEKGFIKADTIAYEDFVEHGGEQGAKTAGKLRQEGKEYIVKDGDVMHFKFNN